MKDFFNGLIRFTLTVALAAGAVLAIWFYWPLITAARAAPAPTAAPLFPTPQPQAPTAPADAPVAIPTALPAMLPQPTAQNAPQGESGATVPTAGEGVNLAVAVHKDDPAFHDYRVACMTQAGNAIAYDGGGYAACIGADGERVVGFFDSARGEIVDSAVSVVGVALDAQPSILATAEAIQATAEAQRPDETFIDNTRDDVAAGAGSFAAVVSNALHEMGQRLTAGVPPLCERYELHPDCQEE